ncbi:type II toxin-antitoxin system RelE family toxin [Candidatus Contubernalis alkaliaceticus]|uniref:type II toxin-antitoxin system RelE family toxin n=1 Tax=Candidatus Contubernalis alkaliaceticus TaxID=338645 RepID=UPI001F4C471D|nr:type II toxin-antitoxin system RelE/ParE family toxin [Candidatus Contubernalis alkalaceticus]UNC93092.1 type II toxin-antitoxin system RelE/ParE family toxin [Candidatus Contubernalis alkalaceticus]
MIKFDIRFKESVAKDLRQLPVKDIKRILRRIDTLIDEPRPTGCEKLSAQERYRVRQGDYRIIYEINDEEHIIIVIKVGHRREVYKQT